jgi:hypothetical protein
MNYIQVSMLWACVPGEGEGCDRRTLWWRRRRIERAKGLRASQLES